MAGGWGRNFASENCVRRFRVAKQQGCFVLVLLYYGPRKIDARKEPTRPGVGKNLVFHLNVRIGTGIPSDWSRRGGRVSANFEVIGNQVLHASIAHEHHQEIGGLAAKLQAPAAASYIDRQGSAPSVFSSAGRYTVPVLPTKSNRDLDERRNDGNALSVVQYLVGNRMLRSRHNLRQHIC